MSFFTRLQHFAVLSVVALTAVTPAWATNPAIQITEASLVLQPPDQTTANCPVSGTYWSGNETTPKIKFRVRSQKPNLPDIATDSDLTITSGYGQSYYKLITAIAYDSSRTYSVKAWLMNNDDQAVASTGWTTVTP